MPNFINSKFAYIKARALTNLCIEFREKLVVDFTGEFCREI